MASTLKFVVVMAMVVTMVMVMSKSVQAVGVFPLQVSEATPMSASVFGGDEISIRGRGFERYSQAQCSWHNNRWYSHAARIINDALIVCETPIIDEPFLSDAPFTTDIAVLFDGDESTRISISLVFRFGPKIDSITPDNGITQGGNYVTIIGSEFDGYSSIEVTFDGAQCLEVAVLNEGTVIRCKAPAGKFNQNAAIDVKFDGHLRTTVRAPTTYHYGPEISTIVPRCGRLTGSTLVTLTGVNLNDPLIYTAGQATTGNVVVEVYLGASVYTSPSATFDGNQIQFITPSITNVDSFGQSVTIGVIFQKLNSRVVVSTNGVPIPFFYGPVLYTASNSGPYNATTFLPISPADGHRGGGDSITLFGCGFSAFSRAQLRPLVDLNGTPVDLCVRGAAAGGAGDTLQVVPGTESANFDRIVCTAAAIDCTAGSSSSLTRTVTLTVTPNLPAPFSTSYTLPSSGSLSYTPGPQITSVSPTDGFYRGGETVSINGKYFFSTVSARVWAVRVLFNTQIPSIGVISRTGNIASDSLITVVTPTNIPWGANVILTIEFFDRQSGAVFCTNLPRGSATTLSFHSGPVCSSVSPSSGSLSGGELVTITGSGFLRGRTDPVGTTDVRICITRLNSAFTLAGTGTCATWEPVSRLSDDFQVTENTIVFRVPDIRQNVRTLVGGNRLFGDQAIVAVAFTDTPNSALAPNITQPVVACGTYRFGPVVTGVALASGPNGPRSAVLSSPGRPGSPVVVLGTNFDDIIYSENVRIDIENINALPSYVVDAGDGFDSTTVRGLTRWGGTVGVQPLTVTFDTCNTTMSSSIISWGPTITRLLGPAGRVPATSTHNPNGDVWGVLPNGGQQITVIGQGFDEFTTGRIRCVVDGSVVATSAVTNIDGGQQVVCTLPARPFATEAQVKLEFARAPCTDLEWLDSVIAKQVVHYEPRIERFSPDFGPTSGNTEVTITGEGFIGWPNFLCHFGHYSTGISAVVAADGTSLTCSTPDQRGEFNTDVRVHVLLGAGAAQAHYRVWAEELFHYGPFCTGVTPTVGLLAGGYDVTLAGVGFQDCVDSNSTHIRNCTFRSFKVHMQDGVTSQDLWVSPVFDSLALGNTDAAYINITLPSNNACNNARKFVIEYLDPVVTRDAQRFISCPSTAVGTFLYGPLFLSQTSEFHRLSTSYGWESTQVTITGERFHDPNIYNSDENIICAFGGIPGTIVTPTTDTTIVCAAPAGAWNTLVNITLEWTAIGVTCGGSQAVTAGKFHYGPVIDAITPKRGYVAGGTPVTVSGFALTCCGINDVKCVYPLEDSVAEFTSTTAKCNVPTNTFIDRQINNIGLRFGSVSFPTNSLSLTEARTSLTYYYGPIITNVQPVRARLSGKNQAITITGEGFADPYFTATYCDFLAEDQANPSSIGNVNVAGATPSDTQIVCPIVPYSHPCGAVDFVRPRWARNCSFVCEHRSELGNNYYKTVNRNPTIEAKERLPFYSDSGSTEPLLTTVEYGPAIVSVTTARGPAPSASPSETLRSFTSGGLVVTVKGDDFGDWIADNNRLDFGTQKAVCLFGDRRSAPATINADSTVVCTVPKGAVGESGPIGITLDPHFDSATQSTYRWLPHVSGISRPWALSRSTGEALIVRGGGFCSFSSVTCLFGNDLFGVSDGPGVIVNDHTVECVPPSRQPGVVNVYLLFCDSSFTTGSCLELPVAEQQRVLVTREFTFVGLTDLSPNELPTCANTRLTLLGNGFSNFDSFRCVVGDQVVPAQRISDSALQCLAPHLPLSDMFHPVTCHSVKVIATSNGQSALLEAPITVEYGVPEVLQVEPSTSDVDDTVEVYVFGQYFRGGDVDGTYMCRFGDITVPGKLTFREVFIDDELELLEAVACIAPNLDTHPDLREGTVYIEVSFNCPDLTFDDPSGYVFTSNRFSYTFTQNPSITAMSPTEGLEVGGTEVTLFGGNFLGGSRYFCSFGTLDSNNDATDNQNQLVSARLIPEGVVESRFSPVVVCLTPANYLDTDTAVDVHLTIDTGKSFIKSPQRFTYLNVGKVVCEARQSSSTASPLALPSMWSALVALAVTMMFALLA